MDTLNLEGRREPQSLRGLLQHLISRSFNTLSTTIEGDAGLAQKDSLMTALYQIYIITTKTLITFRYNDNYKDSDKIVQYLTSYDNYNNYIDKFIQDLFGLYNREMDQLKTPMYDVRCAIDMVVGGGKSRLPLSIYPMLAEPQCPADPTHLIDLVSDRLLAYLSGQNLPPKIKVNFENGMAVLTMENKYALYISYTDFDKPPVVCNFKILLPGYVSQEECKTLSYKRGVSVVYTQTIPKITAEITRIIESAKDDPFIRADRALNTYCNMFEFTRLHMESIAMATLYLLSTEFRGPVLVMRFWNSVLEIRITKTSLVAFLNGQHLYEIPVGRKLEDIVADCKISIAESELHHLQAELKGSTIVHVRGIPTLRYHTADIQVDKNDRRRLFVVGRPDLTPLLEKKSLFERKISQEISTAKRMEASLIATW